MSGKSEKRLRKEIRNQYGEMFEAIADKDARLLKPKPKFFPMFLWIWLMSPFIRIRKKKK
jgi:hypothetical protein